MDNKVHIELKLIEFMNLKKFHAKYAKKSAKLAKFLFLLLSKKRRSAATFFGLYLNPILVKYIVSKSLPAQGIAYYFFHLLCNIISKPRVFTWRLQEVVLSERSEFSTSSVFASSYVCNSRIIY